MAKANGSTPKQPDPPKSKQRGNDAETKQVFERCLSNLAYTRDLLGKAEREHSGPEVMFARAALIEAAAEIEITLFKCGLIWDSEEEGEFDGAFNARREALSVVPYLPDE